MESIWAIFATLMAVLGSSWYSMVTHEWSHYAAGRAAGVPAQAIRVRLRPHPPHVALSDGPQWLSPADKRYVDVFASYQSSIGWAWTYIAAGTIGELLAVTVTAGILAAFGLVVMALILLGTSAAITLVYLVGDVALSRKRGSPAGDFSAMWQISRSGTTVMLISTTVLYALAIITISRL